MLKYVFPLSYNKKTPKKFFTSLLIYLAIYIGASLIPISYLNMLVSLYVFIGGGILMVNYLIGKENDRK